MRIEAMKIDDSRQASLDDLTADDVVNLVRSEHLAWIDIEIGPEDEKPLTELLVGQLDFHPATVSDCLQPAPYHQPKLDEEQDYKFITFLYYENEPQRHLAVLELNIYVGDSYVITVHRHPYETVKQVLREFPAHITGYEQRAILFVHHILDTIADSFAAHLHTFQEQSDELELAVLRVKGRRAPTIGLFRRHQEQLSAMRQILSTRRALVRLRRTLVAELGIVEQLISEHDYEGAPEDSKEIAIYFHDIADHISKYLEIIEGLDRTMNHLMEVHNLVTGHRTNETIYILTIVAAVMLPLNLIVGFFGMNFGNLWFADTWWGIWLVVAMMLALSAVLLAFFRAKGWI
ncbi:magnesium transporter CorA family protein [bacterium]|nr:magnesium transporter CorA family protein [bacterium]